MNKRNFGISEAYQFMAWASEAYPKVFKEWVMINDIKKSVEDNDYPFEEDEKWQ
jgi:hypothetical protein